MGLLDQLWDDTLAGPRPESGLGKLRKHSTFNFRSSSGKETDGGNVRSDGDQSPLDAPRVTRSIMIVKPPWLSEWFASGVSGWLHSAGISLLWWR
ncbi:Dormancy/auxin associated family protein [Melia azedarach]|uniref:Dormancy/auxin associated family protein n=1 Tax=Melia azedarach TaxID=155640 RepID=A0ACC1Y8X1_MELAZ|nr:Dormancy/auxin associated family protein [Melia azedarach]